MNALDYLEKKLNNKFGTSVVSVRDMSLNIVEYANKYGIKKTAKEYRVPTDIVKELSQNAKELSYILHCDNRI